MQLSYSIIPRRLDLFGRVCIVSGKFGEGTEIGGGINWYVFDNRNVRGTFETKKVNHSPAANDLYGYFAGEIGTRFQARILTDF
ncbi:hypothetical protein EP7_003316 [Isosphaeraceae bacterium EP7]